MQRAVGEVERAVARALRAGLVRLRVDDREQREAEREDDEHRHHRRDERRALLRAELHGQSSTFTICETMPLEPVMFATTVPSLVAIGTVALAYAEAVDAFNTCVNGPSPSAPGGTSTISP